MARAQNSTLRIGGKSVRVKVRLNPRARRVIVKVHPSTGEVAVIAPSQRSVPRALDFARQEGVWIADHLSRVPQRIHFHPGDTLLFKGTRHVIRLSSDQRGAVWLDPESERPTIRVAGLREHTPRRVEDWLKKQARTQIIRRVNALTAELGVTATRITVRDTASRWGSCSPSGAISLSWRLIMAPSSVLNYVCAHEVAHLKEMNHGRRFWRLVERLTGPEEAATAQEWLRLNGTELHRYSALRPDGITSKAA